MNKSIGKVKNDWGIRASPKQDYNPYKDFFSIIKQCQSSCKKMKHTHGHFMLGNNKISTIKIDKMSFIHV